MKNKLLIPALLIAAMLGGYLAMPGIAHAAVVDLLVTLNGSARKVGVITAAGSNTTNATTAVPFTLTAGKAYSWICDAAMNVGFQGTCHGTITNANYCLPLAQNVRDWGTAGGSTMAAIGTGNCAVFEMF